MVKKHNMADRVMIQIHKENIKIKPRSYFVMQAVAKIAVLVLLALVASYFLNVVYFKFRIYEILGFLRFAGLGILPFLRSIPYIEILVALSLITAAMLCINNFHFFYKKSFSYVTISLFALIFLTGFAIDSTGINELLKASNKASLIYFGQYTGDSWVIGEIVEMEDKKLKVRIPYKNNVINIFFDENTIFPNGKEMKEGNYIQAVGKIDKKAFYAQGIILSKHYK